MIRFTLVFIGICITAMILLGWYASAHHNPKYISAEGKNYTIVHHFSSEAESYTVFNDQKDTVCIFYGQVDWFGDGAELYWWDIDNDGNNELYCEASPRGAYLKFYPGESPKHFDLSDTPDLPGTKNWLFSELHSNGFLTGDFLREQVMLAIGVITGLLTLIIIWIVRFIRKKKISD
jgi:hypothetical protein